MVEYMIEQKDGFTVVGIGVELTSHYTDFAGLNKEKNDFWEAIRQDGTLEALQAVASNDYLFAVSEAVNNKMMYYAGVMTEANVPNATRMIQFPKGAYVVVKGEATTANELNNQLTGIAFGQVLGEVTEYAYVGGPNASVAMGKRDGMVYGEMWIPVVRK